MMTASPAQPPLRERAVARADGQQAHDASLAAGVARRAASHLRAGGVAWYERRDGIYHLAHVFVSAARGTKAPRTVPLLDWADTATGRAVARLQRPVGAVHEGDVAVSPDDGASVLVFSGNDDFVRHYETHRVAVGAYAQASAAAVHAAFAAEGAAGGASFERFAAPVTDHAMLRLDADGHVLAANPGAEELLRVANADMVGRDFATLTSHSEPESRGFARALKEARATGHAVSDGWRRRPDGTRVFATGGVHAVCDQPDDAAFLVVERELVTDLVLPPRALHESMVLNAVTDAVVAADEEGGITAWNAAATRLLGFNKTQTLGRPLSAVVPGLAEMLNAARPPGSGDDEGPALVWLHDADQKRIPVDVTARRPGAKTRAGLAFVASLRDARPRLAQEREHEELASILDRNDIAVISTDAHFHVDGWNAAAERMFGPAARGVLGRPATMLTPSGGRSAFEHALARVAAEARPIRVTGSRRRTNGSWFRARITLTPRIKSATNEVTGVVALVVDVTAERERQVALARYAAIVASTEDAVVSTDMDGLITTWNPAAARLFRVPAHQATGQLLSTFVGGYLPLARPAASQGPTVERECERADGSTFVASIGTAGIRGGPGAERGFVTIIRDTTPAHEAARRAAELTAELARRNEDLERYAFAVSHDLREPLRAVRTRLDMLEEDAGPELPAVARPHLDRARQGAARMSELITAILDFARSSAAEHRRTAVDVGSVVENVVMSLAPLIEETGATVQAEALPRLNGDPHQLEVIFQNLFRNAIENQGSEPPFIRVAAERHDDTWHITITDNGRGIPPDTWERVFRPFDRGAPDGATKPPHLGIGLSIGRRLAEAHGGSLRVLRSKPGQGSTFLLTIKEEKA